MPKYSLWELEYESIYTVTANKVKDTNSGKEVDKWIDADQQYNVASFYREETELNAMYLQTFNNNQSS